MNLTKKLAGMLLGRSANDFGDTQGKNKDLNLSLKSAYGMT